jgi:hypothetical protein
VQQFVAKHTEHVIGTDIRALLFRKASPSKAECQRQGRGGLAKAVSAPRTSSDPQGAAYAPLSSHRGGTSRRHRADYRTQCQHPAAYEISGMTKILAIREDFLG